MHRAGTGSECTPNAARPDKYVKVDQAMSFADARAHCRANFHDLAAIHNPVENEQVLLACMGEQASSIFGDWVDGTGSFYAGSTITITQVSPPHTHTPQTLGPRRAYDAFGVFSTDPL
jgi:hypothetical protein